jgi:competence protein ComEC
MRPAPAVALAAGYGAGLATGLLRFGDPVGAVWLLGVLAVAAWRRYSGVAVVCAAAAIGRGAGAVAWRAESARCAAALRPGEVRVVIVPRDPPTLDAPARAWLDAGCRDDILVRWPGAAHAGAGERVRVTGRWVARLDGPAGRPGGVLIARVVEPAPGPVPAALTARARLFRITDALYGGRAPLVDALLFDRRGALDPVLRNAYAQAGLVHLLSISGFHVGLIVAWMVLLTRALGVRPSRAIVTATVVALCYVAWLGWPAPATRAAALAVTLCVARLRQRNPGAGALLGFTALVVLLVDPWAIFDLGAWLSVGSLGGATWLTRWSDRALGPKAVYRLLAGSVGATVATAPITAGALGTVALAGIGLNFVGIPLAGVAVPGALASVLLAPVVPPFARALAAGAGAALAALDRLAAAGAAIPGGHITVPQEPASAVPWLALLLAAVWSAGHRTTGTVAVTRAAALAAGALWLTLVAPIARGAVRGRWSGLELDFLAVGQGDAAVLRTPHGHAILVDAGPRLAGRDAGRRVVAPFLRRAGIDRLDAIVLSHAHLDHFGGIPAVLDAVTAPLLLEPGEPVADSAYLATLDAAAAEGLRWAPLRVGDTLRLDGVRLTVLHPDTAWAEWGLDLNEDSAVLLVEWGRFRAVLAGDAGLPAEARMAGRVGDVDLLKVGHHGSRGATGSAWLRELRPEVAVVSVGRGNRYGHPSREALARLDSAGAAVWRTDLAGTVVVRVDSAAMQVESDGRTARFLLGGAGPPP